MVIIPGRHPLEQLIDEGDWFVVSNQTVYGPLAAFDVFQKLTAGEFLWTDSAWSPGEASEWKVLAEIPAFQSQIPQPPPDVIKQLAAKFPSPPIPNIPANARNANSWYLMVANQAYGPFSSDELEAVLVSDKVQGKGRLLFFKGGMKRWAPPMRVPPIRKLLNQLQEEAAERAKERRKSPRTHALKGIANSRPGGMDAAFAAKTEGSILNLSALGIAVSTTQLPGYADSMIDMEILPDPKLKLGIDSFNAKAVITRVFPDKTGFAAKFLEELDPAVPRFIQSLLVEQKKKKRALCNPGLF